MSKEIFRCVFHIPKGYNRSSVRATDYNPLGVLCLTLMYVHVLILLLSILLYRFTAVKITLCTLETILNHSPFQQITTRTCVKEKTCSRHIVLVINVTYGNFNWPQVTWYSTRLADKAKDKNILKHVYRYALIEDCGH